MLRDLTFVLIEANFSLGQARCVLRDLSHIRSDRGRLQPVKARCVLRDLTFVLIGADFSLGQARCVFRDLTFVLIGWDLSLF